MLCAPAAVGTNTSSAACVKLDSSWVCDNKGGIFSESAETRIMEQKPELGESRIEKSAQEQ
jgi:hypothetical protein